MSQPLRLLSLCSGVGVLDYVWSCILGQQIAGQVEIDPYRRAVLARHWPAVPRYPDLVEVASEHFNLFETFGAVDLVAGGIPCQPFSYAGQRGGTADHRYLWPQTFTLVQRCRPSWVLIENVAGFVSLALDIVQADLESAAYSSRAFVLPACAVGAPHIRERVFVLAYAGCPGRGQWANQSQRQPWGGTPADPGFHGPSEPLADPNRARLEERQACRGNGVEGPRAAPQRNSLAGGPPAGRASQPGVGRDADGPADWLDSSCWPALPGYPQHAWEPPRTTSGTVPDRRQRLQALGDAMVAQQVYPFLHFIVEYERGVLHG